MGECGWQTWRREAGSLETAQRFGDRVTPEPGQGTDPGDGCISGEYGDRLRHGAVGIVEQQEPARRDARQGPGCERRRPVGLEGAEIACFGGQLAHELGIAAAGFETEVGQAGVRRPVQARGEHRFDAVAAQPAWLGEAIAVACEIEDRRELGRRDRGLAGSGDEQQVEPVEPAGRVGERPERGAIGVVEIVGDE